MKILKVELLLEIDNRSVGLEDINVLLNQVFIDNNHIAKLIFCND